MSEIQRYDVGTTTSECGRYDVGCTTKRKNGLLVLHSDHIAAIADHKAVIRELVYDFKLDMSQDTEALTKEFLAKIKNWCDKAEKLLEG